MRSSHWAMFIGATVVSMLSGAGCVGPFGNPYIARMKGEVIKIGHVDHHETQVCLSNPVDAGSTYGDRKYSERECWSGVLEVPAPEVGDCVILGRQAEGSVMSVERAHRCR